MREGEKREEGRERGIGKQKRKKEKRRVRKKRDKEKERERGGKTGVSDAVCCKFVTRSYDVAHSARMRSVKCVHIFGMEHV